MVRAFVWRSASFSEKRTGLKAALFVDSDVGFGLMRMMQLFADKQFKFEFEVFRDKEQALHWLSTG